MCLQTWSFLKVSILKKDLFLRNLQPSAPKNWKRHSRISLMQFYRLFQNTVIIATLIFTHTFARNKALLIFNKSMPMVLNSNKSLIKLWTMIFAMRNKQNNKVSTSIASICLNSRIHFLFGKIRSWKIIAMHLRVKKKINVQH